RQALVLLAQPLALLRLAQDEQHLVGLERLGDVVVGAPLHRVGRQIVRAVGGHHDDGGAVAAPAQLVEEIEPRRLRHAHVAQKAVHLARLELGQRAARAGDGRHLEPLAGEEHLQHVPQALLVVDHEDPAETVGGLHRSARVYHRVHWPTPMRITANQVTFTRLVAMPFLAILLYGGRTERLIALVIGFFVGLTDYLDGYLARKQGPTVLGGLMDPLADKVFLALVVLPFAQMGLLPWWATAALLLREFLVTALRSSFEVRKR